MDVSFHLRFCHFLLPFLTCVLVSANSNTNNNNKWDDVIVAQSDYQSLQALKDQLIDSRGVLKSWNNTGIINNNPCSSWAGIKCFKGQVIAIQLPWKGLSGRISEKIGLLKSLRKLSLHDNLLAGPVPASLGFLPNLRGIYLFNNRLSGSIPPSIGNCLFLRTLDLSNNRLTGVLPPGLANSTRLYRLNLSFNVFSGSIPVSLSRSSSLTFLALGNNNLSGSVPNNWGDSHSVNGSYKLRSLALEHNLLSGEIPASLINLSNLSSFDVSYNNLSGVVPSLLAKKFNSTSFAGNIQLCGYTGSSPCPFPGPDSNNSTPPYQMGLIKYHGRKLSTKDVIVIAACSLLIVLLILCCCLLICFLIRKKAASKAKECKKTPASPKPVAASGSEADSGADNGGKLVHFDCDFVFTSDDLLCATAETMGKSAYGTAYKATLEDGSNNTVAVKRLREKITKAKKEFEMEVSALGKIRHPNILSLRAYYLGPKGEKLLVYDYMSNGSLASFLHARGPETSIPWPTRKTIAIGITRGLCFLHTEQNIVHGNLTSSDILLDEQNNPKIAQAGLSRLITSAASTNLIATAGTMGYRAPEFSKLKSASTKTDVFSLGVIILELLTGKSPSDTKDGLDLPHWVASTVKEEWTNQVFDVELLMRDASNNVGDELFDILKLALHCVDPSPEARPEAQQVLQKLEELKPDRADVARGPISGDDGGRAN
ncbi:hypothetical protein OROHE_023908 [Orobanche hederae]